MSHQIESGPDSSGLDLLPALPGPGGKHLGSPEIPKRGKLSNPEEIPIPTGILNPGNIMDPERLGTAALGHLLDEFRPYLLTIAEHTCPKALQPKLPHSDLVQETLWKGYQSFSTFEGHTREELAAWLRRILINLLHNSREAYQTSRRDYRREQPLRDTLVPGRDLTASQTLLAQEERDRFDAAFARLPERLRQVLLLRNRDRLSFAAIGTACSVSETRARDLWVQAVDRLRRELGGTTARPGS